MRMKPIVVKYSCKCKGCQCLLPIGSGAYYSPGTVLCGKCYIAQCRAMETADAAARPKPSKAATAWARALQHQLNYQYHHPVTGEKISYDEYRKLVRP